MATIKQRISLEGAAEVEKQLADIGETGAKAFNDLGEAASSPAAGIAKTGEASEAAAGQIAKAGDAADKAGQSFNQLAQETLKTATAVADLTGTIAEHAVNIGLAVQKHRGWISSLLSVAGGASTATRAIGLLVPELGLLATGIGTAVIALGALAAALAAANAVAEGAATPYSKLSAELEKLSSNMKSTFESTEQGKFAFDTKGLFDSLQRAKSAFAELGISGENFISIMTKISAAIAAFDIGKTLKTQATEARSAEQELLEALLELQKKGGGKAPAGTQQRLEEVKKIGELEEAQKRVADAYERTAAVAANSLKTLLPLIEQIVAGQRDITFDSMVTAAGKIDAVTAAMARAESQGGSAAKVLNDFIANADRLSAIQLGEKFGITAEQVDNIRLLRDTLQEIWDRAKAQPPLFTPEARQALEDMRKATAELRQEQTRLQQAWDSSLFARFAAGYLATITRMKIGLTRWLADFVETGNTFPTRFAGWFSKLPAAFNQSISQAKAIWNSFVTGLPDISWERIKTGATAAWDWVKQKVAEGKQAILDFATSLPGDIWAGLVSGATAAWDWVKQKVAEGKQAVVDFAVSLPGDIWAGFVSGATAAWDSIVQKVAEGKQAILDFAASLPGNIFDAAIAGIQSLIDKVKELFGLQPARGGGGAPAPAFARGGLLGGRGTGTSDSNLAWLSRGEYIMPARSVRQPGVLAFLEALRRSGQIPGFAGGGLVSGGGTQTVSVSVNNMVQAIERNTKAIESQSTVIMQLGDIISGLVQSVENALSRGSGEARGGLLGGRGTGTSDSNLAWVSRGEHIMPARAVRQPGVLAFLEALRRSGGNLRDVLDGMGRFALGGMVPRAIPAFATGGLAAGRNLGTLTLALPDGSLVSGLTDAKIADALRRTAGLGQVRSGGRKPSRYS